MIALFDHQLRSLRACLLIGLLLVLPACVPGEEQRAFDPLLADLQPGTPVRVEIDSGSLEISHGPAQGLELVAAGLVPAGLQASATLEDGQLLLEIQAAGQAELVLHLPVGTTLQVETFDAAVRLVDYEGTVRVDSTAGTILAQQVNGSFTLVSNRGDVSVLGGSGDLALLTNYGLLTLQEVSGRSRASTIMGTIRFSGPVIAGDDVRLETDHGPVIIRLSPGSDVEVQVRTTSGVTDCVVPGLQPQGAGCGGLLGAGLGLLTVRTVSGSVDLQRSP